MIVIAGPDPAIQLFAKFVCEEDGCAGRARA
jgi:hypothetical protein